MMLIFLWGLRSRCGVKDPEEQEKDEQAKENSEWLSSKSWTMAQ